MPRCAAPFRPFVVIISHSGTPYPPLPPLWWEKRESLIAIGTPRCHGPDGQARRRWPGGESGPAHRPCVRLRAHRPSPRPFPSAGFVGHQSRGCPLRSAGAEQAGPGSTRRPSARPRRRSSARRRCRPRSQPPTSRRPRYRQWTRPRGGTGSGPSSRPGPHRPW